MTESLNSKDYQPRAITRKLTLGAFYDEMDDCRSFRLLGYDPPENPIILNRRVGARIGIIDSGIDLEHPQIVPAAIVSQRDFTGEGINDPMCHGTLVTIIASRSIGAEYVPELVIAKVIGENGYGTYRDVLEAIEWITTQGVDIVNISLGLASESYLLELCQLIENKSGILFMAAAGNDGPDVLVYPASCAVENIMCISSLESTSGTCGGTVLYAPNPYGYSVKEKHSVDG